MAQDGNESGLVEAPQASLVAAALPHVVFDGWSSRTLAAAARDTAIPLDRARLAFPRGGVDLALSFHNARDTELARDLATAELGGMRFRDKIAYAVMRRLELVAEDREAVRRAAALFALPMNAADGARAIWHTSDTIWNALGDTSRDFNWYSKRATLSAVYSSAVLYWLGDQTPGFTATREFVNRRVDDVMRFEEVKAKIGKNPLAAVLMRGPQRLLDRVRAPADTPPPDLPGSLRENA